MLFNALNAQIAAQIGNVEDQIRRLQDDLKRLQAHQQEVMSVENAAESAVNQVRTAIAMIQQICPEQLPTLQAAIDAEFTTLPILPPAATPTPAPVPDPDPMPVVDGEAIAVNVEVQPADAPDSGEENTIADTNGRLDTDAAHLKPMAVGAAPLDYSKMSRDQLRTECQQRGITWSHAGPTGKHLTVKEMISALNA